jgi:uncharacterized protein (TIGR01777 family)
VRVLVTGATGLIGSHVCDALAARGDEVLGLTRDPERARRSGADVTWYEWQATTTRPAPEALEGTDGVINLIGESLDQRWTEEAKRRILESRETATHNLVQGMAAATAGPRVLVSQSAVGYYGDRGDALVDEETPHGDDFGARVCVAWEAAAEEATASDVRVVRTRSGLVLSPQGGLLKRLLLPFKLGVGGPLAGGRQYMPWIHIEDEVRLLLWALDTDAASGPTNSTAPNPVTNRELSKTLGRVLGRPAVAPVPKLALKVALGGEMAENALASLRVIPRRAQDLGFEFRFADLEPALQDLLG